MDPAEGRASGVLPDHDEAAHVRRERSRRTASRTTRTSMPWRSARPRRARTSYPCAPRSRRKSHSLTRRIAWRPRGARPARAGTRSRDPRRLPPARPAHVLHRGAEGSPRLDQPYWRLRAAGGRRDPYGLREGLHRAEVISYDDFIACKGEQGAKEAGKMRLEGKEYVSARATSCTSASTCEGAFPCFRATGNAPGFLTRSTRGPDNSGPLVVR